MGFARHKGCGERNRDSLRVTMKEVLVEQITVFVVRAGVFYLLHQRPEKGLLTASYYAIERKKEKTKTNKKNERKNLRLFFRSFFVKMVSTKIRLLSGGAL